MCVTSSASSPPKSAEFSCLKLGEAHQALACDQPCRQQVKVKAASCRWRLCWRSARATAGPAMSVVGDIPIPTSTHGAICDLRHAGRVYETGLTTREFQNCYSEHLVSRDLVSH